MKWRDAKKEKPKGQCLVYLAEEMLSLKIHSGTFYPQGSVIGGHFSYDCPEVLYWLPIEEIPSPPLQEAN